jgi:hypothetical protein
MGTYIIAILVGVIIGMFFPNTPPLWSWVGVLVFWLGNEIVGRGGYGDHWREYRIASYAMYTGPVAAVWVGIMLATGAIGRMLVAFGTAIS